jgi:Trypsin
MVALACSLVVALPLARSTAVRNGRASASDAAQVRIFENGAFIGSGTLVGRNWVLTALHLLRRTDDLSPYSFRFGVTNDQGDGADTSNRRTFDRIELNENLPDLVMVHFADPVPETTWIPELATHGPSALDVVRVYGWAPFGHVLNHLSTMVLDPAATANLASLSSEFPNVAAAFPPALPPMAVNALGQDGDSGAGVFSPRNVLTGVHIMVGSYYQLNRTGNAYGTANQASYEQPVWRYRSWIQSVIDGEGTSGSSAPPGDQPGRRLTGSPTGDLPMTLPPETEICDAGERPCTQPDPVWSAGDVLGAGNYRGTALAVCAEAAGNTCAFDGRPYAAGAIARLALGPTRAPQTAPRQVMIWCKTDTAFAADASARPALRVSFTNADRDEVPVGMGWWDVTPDQVGTVTGTPAVDSNRFATC